jgi:hypothetical protein
MILHSPVPYGWRNEDYQYGSILRPYSEDRPHGGDDYGWWESRPGRTPGIYDLSHQIHAPVSGRVVELVDGGGWNRGWGNVLGIEAAPGVVVRIAHIRSGSFLVRLGDRVEQGQHLATMGNTGDTGGDDHVHMELWIDGVRVDLRPYYDRDLPGTTAAPAGGKGTPLEEEDMTPEQDQILRQTHEWASASYAALFGPKNLKGGPEKMWWVNSPAGDSQSAYYGVLPISIYTQALITQQAAQIAAIAEAVQQSTGGVVDMARVQEAAERGAKAALGQFPTAEQIADAVNDNHAQRMTD